MSKTLPGFSLNSFISPSQARDWYKNVGYEDAKNIIKEKMKSSVENFIAIGYHLKHIDETEQYKEGGYANIWECAKQEFGFSQARASRCINICKAYSVDGDSPYIDEQFKNFNPSQLQEMLPFKDDERLIGQITPDMSSREIRREIRKAKKEGTDDRNESSPLQGQMQITTIEGEYREFEKADLKEEKEEATNLLCNDENIEEAIEFIFDSCNSSTFPQNVLDELVELFQKGEDEHNGYTSQQLIFNNMLPFKNDVVEVSNQCGYMVKYIHTNEWIRIPVYPFWKAFGKYYEWMWKENVCVPDGRENNGDSERFNEETVVDSFHYDLEQIKVFLPCEVGTTVYFCDGNSIEEGIIDQITLGEGMRPQFRVYDTEGDAWFYFKLSDFGNILFYTHEDAEKVTDKAEELNKGD